MEVSSDPYEQKLFQMFTSCDTNHIGTLDENSLGKLCEMLELQDRGSVIIKNLIKNPRSRISFGDFKEALLNFLGTEIDGSLSSAGGNERTLIFNDEPEVKLPDSPNESSDREVSPKFVVGAKKYGRRSRPQFTGTDSSPSESDDQEQDTVNSSNSIVQRSSSQSDILSTHRRRPLSGGAKLKRCASLPAQKNQRVRDAILEKTKAAKAAKAANKINTSSVESLGNLDFENLTNKLLDIWKEYGSEVGTYYFTCDQLKIVCERVGLVRTAAENVAEEVFEKLNKIKTEPVVSFNEFLSLINCGDSTFAPAKYSSCELSSPPAWQFNSSFQFVGHKPLIDTSVGGNSIIVSRAVYDDNLFNMKDIPAQLETLPAHSIIELWERANISSPKGLLLSLGFDEDEVNLLQLSKVLEEELRGLCGEAQTTLLKASLALQTAELSTLKQSFQQLNEENKKMHADNKDANRRVILLAQEIDERHANLEETTKKQIRLLEQRHAEVVRDLTARMSNDRENWSNLTARLEAKIKTFEQEEIKFKTQADSLRQENSALENEQTVLQKQVTSLLEANIHLNKEIVESEERSRNDEGSKNEKDTEEMLELIEKITSLQSENSTLRDKNDELVAEVEGLSFEISRVKTKKLPKVGVVLSTEDDPEHASSAVKRRGDSPSKTRTIEESPRLGKFRRCNADTNSESDTSGDWVALNSELNNPLNVISTPSTSSGYSQENTTSNVTDKDQEIVLLKAKISQLEDELTALKNNDTNCDSSDVLTLKKEKDTLEVRCKELEASLEQMQKAYEDCEDYWQEKLSEERQLFDKERKIYEDEQKESDVKFTELVEKVREYEEQFSKDGRLSPIEEKDVLEQQYADLEAEAEQIRENARQIFEEKSEEIKLLQIEIEDLKLKLGESVEILTGATEMQPEDISDLERPASSPISYLWHQSTIQSPITQHKKKNLQKSPTTQRSRLNNLSTSETTVFSTTQSNSIAICTDEIKNILPIQKPNNRKLVSADTSKDCEDSSSTSSGKSFESQSVASTHSIQKSAASASTTSSSPNIMKEELKRLKYFEIQLKDQIKDLSLQRDGLVMELQQLQEAKPVLEKAYARAAAHPSLMQRVNHLELKNRHLQNVIKQQHHYTESLMQQSWQQQHAELSELRNRLENQGMIMTEQTQRLANADVLVKELYVENSHLTATIQRLEQQMCRVNLIHQHQSLSGLPGMP